jgi:hypothetical protein
VELRREESRRGTQNLIGPQQLLHLLLQAADLGALLRRDPRPHALVDIGLVHPLADRLDSEARLPGDPLHRAVLLPRLGAQLTDQTNRRAFCAFEYLRAVGATPH